MARKKKPHADSERRKAQEVAAAKEVTEILREERGEVTDEVIAIAARDAERSPANQEILERERSRRETFYSDLLYSLCNVRYEEHEARLLWVNLLAHKTEMSDQLGRNVGVRVAALDYFKNIVGLLDDVKIIGSTEYVETARLSVTDGLTGLFNHRYFQDRLERTLVRYQEFGEPVTLLMIDIDYFKQYNDLNGHIAGDVALRELSAILRRSVKRDDLVARYGGEEFAVVLGNTSKASAQRVAERLRREVENTDFPNEQVLPNGQLTVSVGLAAVPDDAGDRAGLVEQADVALYAAKRGGRNRVCWPSGPCRTAERVVTLADLRVVWRPAEPKEAPSRPARLLDISPRGAALAVEELLPAGSALQVTLASDLQPQTLELAARVAWSHELPGSSPMAGLSFEPATPAARAELEQMLAAPGAKGCGSSRGASGPRQS